MRAFPQGFETLPHSDLPQRRGAFDAHAPEFVLVRKRAVQGFNAREVVHLGQPLRRKPPATRGPRAHELPAQHVRRNLHLDLADDTHVRIDDDERRALRRGYRERLLLFRNAKQAARRAVELHVTSGSSKHAGTPSAVDCVCFVDTAWTPFSQAISTSISGCPGLYSDCSNRRPRPRPASPLRELAADHGSRPRRARASRDTGARTARARKARPLPSTRNE